MSSNNEVAHEARVTVQPQEIDEPLVNPYMGWIIWTGPRYFDGTPRTLAENTTGFGDDAPLFNCVMGDWMWADLEPSEGNYQWEEFDAVMGYWQERGKQFFIRLWVTDDPGWNGFAGNTVIPQWVWDADLAAHHYRGEGGSQKQEPDYVDPSFQSIYLPRLTRFLTAFAARYIKPEIPIILMQVMGYGQWGEWHTLWSHYPWPSPEIKHEVLTTILNAYTEIFTQTQLCVAYVFDTDNHEVKDLDDFLYRQALDVAVQKGLAFSRHGFIDGLGQWDTAFMERFWPTHCLIAEGDWSYLDVKNCVRPGIGTIAENIEVMLAWHSTHASFYIDANSYRHLQREDLPLFAHALQSGGLGYRFVLTEASWPTTLPAGATLQFQHTWRNRNVGHSYKRFPLRLFLLNSAGEEVWSATDSSLDQRPWINGPIYHSESIFTLPSDLPAGSYGLAIALVHDQLTEPIQLAISGRDAAGRYLLGALNVP